MKNNFYNFIIDKDNKRKKKNLSIELVANKFSYLFKDNPRMSAFMIIIL